MEAISDTGVDVRQVVVEELAAALNETVAEVETRLVESNGAWPGDSLLLAEVLVMVEERLQIVVELDDNAVSELGSLSGLVGLVEGQIGGGTV